MMFHTIIRHAKDEERPLDAHDEKSQGLTSVFKKAHDDDNKQSLGTSSTRFGLPAIRTEQACARGSCQIYPGSSS